MSRSKDRNQIDILVAKGVGAFPPYIHLAQRHFEKEMPTIPVAEGGIRRATVTAPTDLMRLVLPSEAVDQIESLEMTYEKKI